MQTIYLCSHRPTECTSYKLLISVTTDQESVLVTNYLFVSHGPTEFINYKLLISITTGQQIVLVTNYLLV
jgi:hypothetical protein